MKTSNDQDHKTNKADGCSMGIKETEVCNDVEAEGQMLLIYYLSGTGNALVAARWFAERARERAIPAEIIPIDRFRTPIEVPGGEKTLIGFMYPTHGFSLPWYMLRFVAAFPRGHRDIFCLNTFGGTKIGKFHLPGLSGLALVLPALLFLLKGYRVRGLASLNLPSNWISLHPGLTPSAISSLADYCRKRVDRYAASLLSGGTTFDGIISLPLDLAVAPIAFGYMVVGRFWLAKMYLATLDCDGCGICVSCCPTDALKMKDGRPFWTFRCESCMRCINVCPRKAIQVSHLFAVATAYVLYGLLFPFAMLLVMRFAASMAGVDASGIPLMGFIRAWAILGVMFLTYRLVHALTRFRPVNYLFAGFSLTRLRTWRRYLAPGVTVKDFRFKPGRKNHNGD
jgi:Pyruvate/2-oxoacid:ferredoxin oxidoreductase delta subunit